MGLFRKTPPPRSALQRRVPRPWDPPETEFPAIVPINTLLFDQSEQTAIAITGISAYSNGFEIVVTRIIQPDAPGFDEDPVPGAPRGTLAERQSFQISLQLSDGRTVTSGRPHGDAEPTGPICDQTAVAARRTVCACGGGHGRCRQADRWSSSASSAPARRGPA
jgi:hypothetical protein